MAVSSISPRRKGSFAADVKVRDVDLVLASLLFFHPVGADTPIYSFVEYSVIVYLSIKNIRLCGKIPLAAVCIIVFAAIMCLSTYSNTHSLTWAVSGFMFGMEILAVALAFLDGADRLSWRGLLRRVFAVFVAVLLLNDIAMIALPYDRSDPDTLYLIGNKFVVSYSHCLFGALAMVLHRDKKAMVRMILILCAALAYFAGSTTGALIMAAMIMMTLFPRRLRSVLSNPIALALAVVVVNMLIWGAMDIFHNPHFQDFLVNVLGKSPDMTGRERLYNATFDLVEAKPLFGYGYLTDVYRVMFGYGNAQNGLFHLITQCGIVGSVFYFGGLFAALLGKSRERSALFGLYAYLFAMILGSSVEINLSAQFAFGVALLCACLSSLSDKGEKCSSAS